MSVKSVAPNLSLSQQKRTIPLGVQIVCSGQYSNIDKKTCLVFKDCLSLMFCNSVYCFNLACSLTPNNIKSTVWYLLVIHCADKHFPITELQDTPRIVLHVMFSVQYCHSLSDCYYKLYKAFWKLHLLSIHVKTKQTTNYFPSVGSS